MSQIGPSGEKMCFRQEISDGKTDGQTDYYRVPVEQALKSKPRGLYCSVRLGLNCTVHSKFQTLIILFFYLNVMIKTRPVPFEMVIIITQERERGESIYCK